MSGFSAMAPATRPVTTPAALPVMAGLDPAICPFPVMAGLDPALCQSTVLREMAGSSPAMTTGAAMTEGATRTVARFATKIVRLGTKQ
jgi:hypothetical protein